MNREEILQALEAQEFDRLVGVAEDGKLEFKGAPYDLDNQSQVLELAKDVSGLANAAGGLIVIGFRTHRVERQRIDLVSQPRPFARELFDADRALRLMEAKIHPRIEGLSLKWRGTPDDADRGVLIVDVPKQDEDRKYFLVIEPIDEGRPTPGHLVGLSIRRGSDVTPESPQDIYRMIRDGRNIFSRLAAIETRLEILDELRAGAAPGAEERQLDENEIEGLLRAIRRQLGEE